MRCLGPLCGLIVGPLALTAGGAAFLGTLAGLALAACAAAESGRLRSREGAEERAGEAAAPEPTARRRGRGRAL